MPAKKSREKPYEYKPKFPAVELTAAQLELKAKMDQAKADADAAEKEYQRLRTTCTGHLFLPQMTEELREGLCQHQVWTWKYDHATCEVCRKGFGYRCPESPDEVCHYYTAEVDGKPVVELSTGEKIPYTVEDHDPKYETDDSCLYCGAPEERK